MQLSSSANNNININTRQLNTIQKHGPTIIIIILLTITLVLVIKNARLINNNNMNNDVVIINSKDMVLIDNKANNNNNKIISTRKIIDPLRSRFDFPFLLESEHMTSAVELGVQNGEFAEYMLSHWPSCKRYVLVDKWAHLENYDDHANIDDKGHESYYKNTMRRMEPFRKKKPQLQIEVCRDFTSNCVKKFQGEQFDFVYVDARHDYKGVMIDLQEWWPLVKENGIMAGHDFVTQDEGPQQSNQNWTINFDGSVDHTKRVVRGAIVDFFSQENSDHYRQVVVVYREDWPSWYVRK
jgi:hypothetical protein